MVRVASGPGPGQRPQLLHALLRRTTPAKKNSADRLFDATLAQARAQGLIPPVSRLAAIDSTGLESRHVSHYFTRRCHRHRGHKKARYPKLSAICDTRSHLVLGLVADRGPKPDAIEDEATLDQAWRRQKFTTLLGDAGYESERFHRRCREDLGVRSIIPTTERGRPRKDGRPRPVRGHYRQLMRRRFPKKTYGQRWQIETVFSMIKRNLGAALTARSYHRQNREIALRLLTHNLMILLRLILQRAFQQSKRDQKRSALLRGHFD